MATAQMSADSQNPQTDHKGKTAQFLAWSSCDPFIVATDKDSIKPDGRRRRFIRRHVMKGKNQKRSVDRPPALKSWFDRENDLAVSQAQLCPQLDVSLLLVGFDDRINSHMLQDAFKCTPIPFNRVRLTC